MNPFQTKLRISQPTSKNVCELLAQACGLSKTRVKLAMRRGAVWLDRQPGRSKRLRRATTLVRPGDTINLFYDPEVLDAIPPAADCVLDGHKYSIWFKPAGLMTQGTRYGDHCSLARQVEQHFHPGRPVNIVHRLDREVPGLVLVAHGREAAARFSAMLQKGEIYKEYQVVVLGDLTRRSTSGWIDQPLDGKSARTFYTVLHDDPVANQSWATVRIETGRLHQIRRHFATIGFPVIGDPRYGKGNKNHSGLRLTACVIAFECPFGQGAIRVEIDPAAREALSLITN